MEKNSKSDGLIQELLKIAEIEGISRSQGVDARKKALMGWLKNWIVEIKCSQHIIDRSFSPEEEDFIKYHMAKLASEDLMEECATLNRQKNLVEIKLFALRREKP